MQESATSSYNFAIFFSIFGVYLNSADIIFIHTLNLKRVFNSANSKLIQRKIEVDNSSHFNIFLKCINVAINYCYFRIYPLHSKGAFSRAVETRSFE